MLKFLDNSVTKRGLKTTLARLGFRRVPNKGEGVTELIIAGEQYHLRILSLISARDVTFKMYKFGRPVPSFKVRFDDDYEESLIFIDWLVTSIREGNYYVEYK